MGILIVKKSALVKGDTDLDAISLIDQENYISYSSIIDCGSIVRNTELLIGILSKCVEIKDQDATAFFFLHKQVQNGLYQCFLSSLRKHEIQAKLMLRHSIETACLSTYSLHNINLESYLIKDEFGAKPTNINKKVYAWLDKNYSEQSFLLKMVKNQINEYYAHGNMFASLRTRTDRNALKDIDFFDKKDLLLDRSYLWQIGYVAIIIFDLTYQAAKTSNIVIINKEAFKQFKLLVEENQQYRTEFMKEERLSRWVKLDYEK